jgi:hypothetical protein
LSSTAILTRSSRSNGERICWLNSNGCSPYSPPSFSALKSVLERIEENTEKQICSFSRRAAKRARAAENRAPERTENATIAASLGDGCRICRTDCGKFYSGGSRFDPDVEFAVPVAVNPTVAAQRGAGCRSFDPGDELIQAARRRGCAHCGWTAPVADLGGAGVEVVLDPAGHACSMQISSRGKVDAGGAKGRRPEPCRLCD